MKFTELEEEDVEYIGQVYFNKELSWDQRMYQLSERFKRSERTIRHWIAKLGYSTKSVDDSPQLISAKAKELDRKKKRFIITWAQNDTPVHDRFFDNLERYAEEIDAAIHVIAGRYKNPTSVFTDKSYDTWAQRVDLYLDANRHDVHRYLSIMSDVKIQPTAVDPMTGLEGMSGVNSCVFGSPKVQLETIPVLQGNRPKMMVTTGACTMRNYTDSKAGKKGEFHHTLGFVIIEIKDDDTFFLRQVTATDSGDFSDLYFRVAKDESTGQSAVTRLDKIEAIVWGDLHYGKHDPKILDSTFDLMAKLSPDHVVLHDVFDGYSINHHESKDPFIQYQKEVEGSNSLKGEIDEMLKGLEDFQDYNVVVVRSNHDDFVDRWLKDTDWRKTVTPKNSLEYMQYAAAILNREAPNGVIPYVINRRFPHIKTLGRNDSYIVKGWELGQHGDVGSNGSRGSLAQFRKLNAKLVVGHYHAPGRKDGALAVGTSTHLRVGYNTGASSWLQSHVIIHTDGKAQHIHFTDGEFTTFK
jgi:transposase